MQGQDGGVGEGTTIRHRVAATAVLGLSGAAAMIAFGAVEANMGWFPMWAAMSALYTVGAVGLWRGESWSRGLMLGVLVWGLAVWTQSMFAVGVHDLSLVATCGHALGVLALLVTPRTLVGRHRASLALAGAALPASLIFGLAPMQSASVGLLLVGGAFGLLAMAIGIARGRTWGLLAALATVPTIIVGVCMAPAKVGLQGPHPMMPEAVDFPNGVLLLGFVGTMAAVLAAASVLPFAAPIVRFVRRAR